MDSIIYGKLPGAVFPFHFYNGVLYFCCAMRATFSFDEAGKLELLEDQPGLVFGDQFDLAKPLGEHENYMTTRDMLFVSDLTPIKLLTDVLVIGQAQAPGGKPLAEWFATVQVGPVKKTLRISGPRKWLRRQFTGDFRLTAAEPTVSAPLLYSRAYGGRLHPELDYAALKPSDLDERNPLGCGFEAAHGGTADSYPAPQIEYPGSLVTDNPKHKVAVAGFSPLPPYFIDRLNLSGTYDKNWKDKVAPNIPKDMKLEYWNVSPRDQQARPYLKGNETLTLDGLLASGMVKLELPDLIAWMQVDTVDGKPTADPMSLDTVTVNLDDRLLMLRWGSVIQASPEIARISLHCPRQERWNQLRKGT